MKTADDFVPGATSGNTTGIDIAASPEAVWKAMHTVTFGDLGVTRVLMGIRSIPARMKAGGTLAKTHGIEPGMLDAMAAGQFCELDREEGQGLTLGLVGQFWKLNGGEDAEVRSSADFVAFDRPGFVKSAIDFVVEPTPMGSRLTTRTKNWATDPVAHRKFRRYWRLVGPGSKAIRFDMLRAIRHRAEER